MHYQPYELYEYTDFRKPAHNSLLTALSNFDNNDYEAAISNSREALSLIRSIPKERRNLGDLWLLDEAYSILGESLYATKDYINAINAFEHSLELLPLIREIEAMTGRHRDSESDCTDGYLYNQLARLNHKMGNTDEAKRYNDKARKYYETRSFDEFRCLYDKENPSYLEKFDKERNEADQMYLKLNSHDVSVTGRAGLFGKANNSTNLDFAGFERLDF